MPSGAKKRRALRKKKQQEAAIRNSTNNSGDNLYGIDERGSQDDKGSDSSLSSPGSQENEAFGRKDQSADLSSDMVKGSAKKISGDVDVTMSQGLGPKNGNAIVDERETDYKKNVVEKSPNPSPQSSTHPSKNGASQDASGLVKGSAKEISGDADVTPGLRPNSGNAIAVESGTSYQKNIVEKSPNSSSQNSTHTTKNVASQGACGSSVPEIVPVVRSHVKPAVSEKSELIDTATQSNLVKQKCDENGANPSPRLEKENTKGVNLPRSAAETSKKVESVRESEVPVYSEEKRLLLPGPPVVRTSWLSCCGLFDAMTGSER